MNTPAPAPANSGDRLRIAVAANGAPRNAMPTPAPVNGNNSRQIGVAGVISIDSQTNEMANTAKPSADDPARVRAVHDPTYEGRQHSRRYSHAVPSAAPRASPTARTPVWAKNITGSTMAVQTKAITATPRLDTEKLRSLNSAQRN